MLEQHLRHRLQGGRGGGEAGQGGSKGRRFDNYSGRDFGQGTSEHERLGGGVSTIREDWRMQERSLSKGAGFLHSK